MRNHLLAVLIAVAVAGWGAPAVDSAAAEATAAETNAASTVAGHWEGSVALPNGELPMVVDLDPTGDGWQGWLDVPAQGISDLELSEIQVDGGAVHFTVAALPGGATFDGTLEGDTLAGTFSQAGQSLTLSLERTAAAAERPAPPDPKVDEWVGDGVPGEGLAGGWRGALRIGSMSLRLEIDLELGDDGFSGTMVSIDQNSGDIPLNGSQFGSSVKLTVPAIGGSFEGTMSEDGSEIAGDWSQGPQSLPLVLKRQAES